MARAETPAEERFIVVYQFMWKSLGLSGVTLSVFARIYGFCRDGTSEFYESRTKTAEFLGTTTRTVTRSVNELVSRSLVVQTGTRTSPSGNVTRSYRLGYAVHDMRHPLTNCHSPTRRQTTGRSTPTATFKSSRFPAATLSNHCASSVLRLPRSA